MKKQFAILLILMFVMSLVLVNFDNLSYASTGVWQTVGEEGFYTGDFSSSESSLGIDGLDTLYFAYTDYTNDKRVTVAMFNGSNWENVGDAGFSVGVVGGQANTISLAISSSNVPYVAYVNDSPGGDNVDDMINVMKFSSGVWQSVGDVNFRNDLSFTNIAIDGDDIPHVVFTDSAYGNKLTVMKFNGSTWEVVGIAGFSAGQSSSPSLKFSSDNIPYVAYQDHANSSGATVMSFNDGAWQTVGNANFSVGGAVYPSLEIDNSNTPHVAFMDYENGEKATVMKFNGSIWKTVGNAGFSAGKINYFSFAIDNNIPYVAYRDYANGFGATVMSFNGGAWQTVGNANFSAGGATDPSLAFSSNNVPYVAYSGYVYEGDTAINKAVVKKFVECTEDIWECDGWSICSIDGNQTRNCTKTIDCSLVDTPSPSVAQSCIPECTEDTWTCDDWGSCSESGRQTRICLKEYDCPLIENESPETERDCEYVPPYTPPACSEDIWECGSWSTCSPSGIQNRTCNKTYDCSSVETAPPAASQYCEAPDRPSRQTPSDDLGITNQDSIIKSTVKLLCPVNRYEASQGSGTVIDSSGTILTNKHVIDGTAGCLVGFIDNYDDEPYFRDRQIADIYKVSNDEDIAILKLRNPYSRSITSIDITKSNSNNLSLGDKITTYGYPADFGEKITYTSGDFSGVEGNYLKTTAILEYGNSGGGAYLKNGTFIGIPSAVVEGELNSMGYILSINKINSWLNGSPMAYNYSDENEYSRVSSLLESIDLSTLDSLNLFVSTKEDEEGVIIDQALTNRLKGYILLQVEEHGEAWYVDSISEKRYYLRDGAVAYEALREFGLGITNADLKKIPVGVEERFDDVDSDGDGLADKLEEGLKTDVFNPDTDGDGLNDGYEVLTNNSNPLGTGYLNYSNSLVDRLRGRILLQVESRGEAWYIHPDDGKRYYMKDGDAAYQIMRFLSLGITDNDLNKIPSGSL